MTTFSDKSHFYLELEFFVVVCFRAEGSVEEEYLGQMKNVELCLEGIYNLLIAGEEGS